MKCVPGKFFCFRNIFANLSSFQGQKVYNVRFEGSEQIHKLLMVTADDYEEVDDVGVGNIVAVTGLKVSVS